MRKVKKKKKRDKRDVCACVYVYIHTHTYEERRTNRESRTRARHLNSRKIFFLTGQPRFDAFIKKKIVSLHRVACKRLGRRTCRWRRVFSRKHIFLLRRRQRPAVYAQILEKNLKVQQGCGSWWSDNVRVYRRSSWPCTVHILNPASIITGLTWL